MKLVEILASLKDHARDTVDFLGNRRKAERERKVAAAFLRCAGIEFNADQLVSSPTEPPDVLFEDACFEVVMVLPPGRRMHAEWKERAGKHAAAKSLGDLIEPYTPPRTITQKELVELITPAANQKAQHYTNKGLSCGQLDLLVYVNDAMTLDPCSPQPDPARLVCTRLEVSVCGHPAICLYGFCGHRCPGVSPGSGEGARRPPECGSLGGAFRTMKCNQNCGRESTTHWMWPSARGYKSGGAKPERAPVGPPAPVGEVREQITHCESPIRSITGPHCRSCL